MPEPIDPTAPEGSGVDHARAIAIAIAAAVDRWHFEAFHGSVVARDTEIWNHVFAAKEALKAVLAAAMREI